MDPIEENIERKNERWIDEEIREAMSKMLPVASGGQYTIVYDKFQEWRTEHQLTGPTSEKQIFAYLYHMLESNKWVSPGTLWSRFSMLRTMILSREGLDIKGTNINSTIQTWLKRLGATHRPKQAHIFSKEETRRFIQEAPEGFMVQKLVLLVGVYTGLRCDTLTRLEWRHVRIDREQVSIFVDYESKTDQGANGMWFALAGSANDPRLDAYVLFTRYKQILEKKSKELTEGRLWRRIDMNKNGTYKVSQQVRGIEWISTVATKVATWLCLPEAGKYTGHSLRRTCAQWATDNGMSETQMQHHFGWKSSSMVVRYSRSSNVLKQAMAKNLDLEADEKEKNKDEQISYQQSFVGKRKEEISSVSSTARPGQGNQRDEKSKESDDGEVIYAIGEKRRIVENGKENEQKQATPSVRADGARKCNKLPAFARAADANSHNGVTQESDEVASPSTPAANVNSTIGGLFSGCTFGNASFSINIQHNSSSSPQPTVVYTSIASPNPVVRNSSSEERALPRIRLFFKEEEKE